MSKNNYCFLCRRKLHFSSICEKIDNSFSRASKKPLKDVLNHLAQCTKIELHIPKHEVLCGDCHFLLIDYDRTLMTLLRKQKKLTALVDKALMGYNEIEEDLCIDMSTLEEFSDERFMKEMEVSDGEMEKTIREATETNTTIKSNLKKSPQFIPLDLPCEMLQCNVCTMRFRSKIRLHKHIVNAHKKYTCEVCDYSHRNEDYVKLHMNLHEGKSENQCRYCDKEFSTKISTMRHMEVHMDTKKYQCDKCGLCFSQTTVMYNHKLQHEAEEQPLRCDICSQIFKTKRTFRHHMVTHREDRPRHSCEYCGKTFTEKYTLKVHKRTHHENDKVVEVNMQPDTSTDINKNLSNVIEGTEIFSIDSAPEVSNNCNQNLSFKDQIQINNESPHQTSVSVVEYTPYELVDTISKKACDFCGQIFIDADLEYHILSEHTNQ